MRFAPGQPDSVAFNPLHSVIRHPDRIWQDCKKLASLMARPKTKDDMWERRGFDLVTLALAYSVLRKKHNATAADVLDLNRPGIAGG